MLDPLWDQLIVHNQVIRNDLRLRTSSRLVEGTYGSMGRQRCSLRESGLREDEVDAPGASGSVEVLTATDEELSRPLIQVTISIFSY